MVWFLGIWPGGPLLDWQDKSGLYADECTPLPFGKLTPSSKVIDQKNIPRLAKYVGKKKLPDAFWIGDTAVISESLKVIIQENDPNNNQFFPIKIILADNSVYGGKYFIFHPTNRVNCVLLSKSKIRSKIIVQHGPRVGMPIYSVESGGFAISKIAYGDRKVFGSIFLGNDGIFVVDEIISQIKDQKMTNLMMYPVLEYNEPWVMQNEASDILYFINNNPSINTEYNDIML